MYNQPMYPNENYSQGYWQDHHKCEKDCDNTFYITTTITQTVSSTANGGPGGDGGDAGNVAGGSAAAAAAAGEGNLSNAEASTDNSDSDYPGNGPRRDVDSAGTKEVESLEVDGGNSASASAQGGAATGGTAGSGGIGGVGGTSEASASAAVTNVVVINCDGHSANTALSFGSDDKKLDVTVDKDGNTYVNGQKMYEQQLNNGSKVFVFRTTEQKSV